MRIMNRYENSKQVLVKLSQPVFNYSTAHITDVFDQKLSTIQ